MQSSRWREPAGELQGGRRMDGIHLLGEWYGCPARHAGVHSRRSACACLPRRGAQRRPHVVGDSLPPVRAAGRHGHGAARRIASRDPHVAGDGLRHRRRLRVQLTTDNTRRRSACFARSKAALQPEAHALSRRSAAAARMTDGSGRSAHRRAAAASRTGAMTEYLTDDWGFFIRSARQLENFRSAVPGGRSARHACRSASCSGSTATS